MKRLLVLVEGQTEEAFVRDVLTPHLNEHRVHPESVLLKTPLPDTGAAGPSDFPGMRKRPPSDPYARISVVENAFAEVIDEPRFIPHLVLHELEAWVYSAPDACSWVFDAEAVAQKLASIANGAGGPERINEDPNTAPSKRLMNVFPQYQKTLHGPMALEAIGLSRVRAQCPHASSWLERLEQLGLQGQMDSK